MDAHIRIGMFLHPAAALLPLYQTTPSFNFRTTSIYSLSNPSLEHKQAPTYRIEMRRFNSHSLNK